MNATDAKNHLADIRDQLSLELFNKETLTREIAILRPKFESSIVQPKTTNIKNISKDDLNIDVIPATMANMETIQARKAFYYATKELVQVNLNIESLKNMYYTYQDHIKQDLEKQNKPLSDTMIFEAYGKARDIKDLTPEEAEAVKGIGQNLITMVHSGKEARIQAYETLQNVIAQHTV